MLPTGLASCLAEPQVSCQASRWPGKITGAALIQNSRARVYTQKGSVSVKATDFDLSRDIRFDIKKGITSFRDTRLLIFDANAIGLLRHKLIETLGMERARDLWLQFGFQNGYADFTQMKLGVHFDTEMDLLASGPVIHTWEGIVQATPKEIRFDRATGDFYFTGVWTNSYEAEQHRMFYEKASFPTCWSVSGYATGWCTAFFDRPLLAIEPVCAGKGDDRCEWLIQPPKVFGDLGKPYVKAFQPLWDAIYGAQGR